MPKKQFVRVSKLRVSEPSVIFVQLLDEFRAHALTAELEEDRSFKIVTPDPAMPSFADELIHQYYPPRHQLLLDS